MLTQAGYYNVKHIFFKHIFSTYFLQKKKIAFSQIVMYLYTLYCVRLIKDSDSNLWISYDAVF